MTRVEFREKWGPQWAALVASAMWQDALTTAETELGVFKINGITDEEIHKNGSLLIKGMQAHTRFETTLATLAEKPFEFTSLPEDYPDPAKEADELAHPPKKPRKKKTP